MIRLKSLSSLLLVLLLGCSSSQLNTIAHSDPGGIGGTGAVPENEHSGIGGTGRTHRTAGTVNRDNEANDDEGGIGGTGRVAKGESGIGGTGKLLSKKQLEEGIGGTGIVGIITGFGSIWVNNAHVHFDAATPITINQAPASAGELQLGQVVAVNAMEQADAYQARSIDIVHEVVGPIASFAEAERQLNVLNQTILLSDDTLVFDTQASTSTPSDLLLAGAFVEISGLREANGDIIASRIDVIDTPEQLQVIGELAQTDDGSWQVNGLPVEVDDILLPEELDRRHLISGQLIGDQFVVEAIDLDSIEGVLELVNEVIIDGYFFEEEMDGVISIGDMEFVIEDLEAFEDGEFEDEQWHHEDDWHQEDDWEHEEEWEHEDWDHDEEWDEEHWHDEEDWYDEEYGDEFDEYDEEFVE